MLSKVLDLALAIAILGLLGLVALRFERISSIQASGVADIADGDSLRLDGQRIRLRGIDAPEFSQTCRRNSADYACGRMARDALRRLVANRQVACEGWERDRYGRLLALCSAGGVDLNREQVAAGWAIAYGSYASEEATARAAKRGVWAGDFERPGDWRVRHGDMAESPHDMLGTVWNWLRQVIGIGAEDKPNEAF